MKRFFASSRYLLFIAVAGAFLLALALFIYGAIFTVRTLFDAATWNDLDGAEAKQLMATAVQVADVFLVGTVLFIIALGLYALFIDDDLDLPPWLEIHDLEDLKSKLVSVVIVALGVLFLGQAVGTAKDAGILDIGLGTAAMVAALTLFYALTGKKSLFGQGKTETRSDGQPDT
ncbi:MAG: YqhA family protein [Actinomycetia bacterium]|nr:YqhA family protein [Actinomycetes bacterium]MCP4226486.1 YqhA family protein [Actinomycetes bacterium]MCP5031002.1 YqhA family protein [Actinomycetes bacterium]